MKNINGYCPHCNADLDGALIVDSFIGQGRSEADAVICARQIDGWKRHGILNRWSRAISLTSVELDYTLWSRCPDCDKDF